MGVALTHLIPIQELTPGAVGAIRNEVIAALVKQASEELTLSPDKLVVRDVRPFSDLQMYDYTAHAASVDEWQYDASTTTAAAFTTVTGAKTMGDQRYVALFGVRDLRMGIGVHTTAMNLLDGTAAGPVGLIGPVIKPGQMVSLIKINVGGADKVIWDITSLQAYPSNLVGFSPSAVIIPQNASFNIFYYFKSTIVLKVWLQLIGVVVEPRGKVISP